MSNFNITRIVTKIQELFGDKLDVSDVNGGDSNIESALKSRALAAITVLIETGKNKDVSAEFDIAINSVTDGYHDLGIDAIYCDETQKKLILVQSKWHSNGQGSISHEEMSTFVGGIKRVLDGDLNGANDKIQRKTTEIETAISAIDYQIVCVFCHTGGQISNDYARRPILELMTAINIDGAEAIVFRELLQSDFYSYLAKGVSSDSISIDDVFC
ncbi:hypothetical protein FACS1894105_11040 [Clostridia bacterium]|nr:hypothetical protein FACS1894105_11040 [Clostridia bacterium]